MGRKKIYLKHLGLSADELQILLMQGKRRKPFLEFNSFKLVVVRLMTQIKKGKVDYPYSKLLHALEEVASMHEFHPKGTVRRFGLNRNKLRILSERHMGRPLSGFHKGSRLNRAKKYTAAQLMAQCDSNAPYPIDAEWENMPAVGKELQW